MKEKSIKINAILNVLLTLSNIVFPLITFPLRRPLHGGQGHRVLVHHDRRRRNFGITKNGQRSKIVVRFSVLLSSGPQVRVVASMQCSEGA